MQIVDKYGNTFGQGHLIVTSKSGKPKVPTVTVAWGNITGILSNQTDLQNALNLKVPTARTITINGNTQDLSADRTWTISTGITVNTTPITGGSTGRLLFDNAGVVSETSGINWNPVSFTLSLLDSPFYSQAGNSSANTDFSITGTASSNYTIYSSRQFIFNTGQSMYFNTDTDGGSALDRAWYFAGARTGMTGGRTYGALTVDSSGFPSFTLYNNDNGPRILLASNATSYFNGGNLLVGTTTDAGYKLDVTGTVAVRANLTVFSESEFRQNGITNYITSSLGIFRFRGWSSGVTTAYLNGWNQESFLNSPLNIGSTSTTMASMLSVYGSRTATSAIARGVYFNNTLVAAANNDVLVGLDIAPTYTNGAFTDVSNVALRIASTTSIVRLESSLVSSFHGIEFRNASNLDAEIKQLPSSGELKISNGRSVGWGGFITFYTDTVERMRISSSTGNVLINTTTDAGFKLDVNGSSRVTSLKTADIFPASASISLWTNSLNASSRFYTAPVHQDGRINFNAIAGGSDQVLIRAWHTGQFGLGTGSSSAGGALTIRGDSLLIGTSGSLFFMNGTFGPLNVPYRLGISTSATTAAFYSGVENNQTNIESTKFEFTATSHTFYTGTTTGNQSNPNQFIPLHLSNLGNVTIGSKTDAGFKFDVAGTARIQSTLSISNPSFISGGSITHSANATLVITGGPGGGTENITFGPSNRIFINAAQSRFPNGSVQIASTLSVGVANATSQNMIWATGGITASSAIARGIYTDTTLTASANNDVLVGLDIAPTYTNGAFTGLANIDLRTKGAGVVIGSGAGYGAIYGYDNDGLLQLKTNGTSTELWFRPNNSAASFNSSYWGTIIQESYSFKILSGSYQSLVIATARAGGNGGIMSFSGATGAANNAITIAGPANAGRIALVTYGSSPITLNGGNILINTTTDAGYKLDVTGSIRAKGNSLTISASGVSTPPANYVAINFDDTPNHHQYWFAINSKKDISGIGTSYDRIIFPTMGNDNSTWEFNALGTYSRIRISARNNASGNYLDLTNSSISLCGPWTVVTIDRSNRQLVFGNMSTDVHHLSVYDLVIKGAQPFENNSGNSNGGNVYIVGGTPSTVPAGNYGNVILAHDGTTTRGNVLIGTSTNGSFKLDVNGSARVQSGLTVSGSLNLNSSDISSAWTTYTPTWSTDGATQPSLGDGTITGAYKVIGKTVFVRVRLVFGTTTTAGTGAFYFSLPVSAATAWGIQMPVSILDNGNAWYQATVNGEYGGFTDRVALITQSAGGANSSQGVTGVFPITFANTDSIQFNGSYESA